MAEGNGDVDCHDLSSLLGSEGRDFLVRNNGDQVKIKDLSGKIVGLYFSTSSFSCCRAFTPNLVEVYRELSSKGDFEVVYIPLDWNEESFEGHFAKMPWLAIPFSDSTTSVSVSEKLRVSEIPHLAILDRDGRVSTNEGWSLVKEHEAGAYPFTTERIKQLKEEEEEAKRNQSLKFLLASHSRDYVISSDDQKIPVSELEGKIIGLYFCDGSTRPGAAFRKDLVNILKTLKGKGENFEIVLLYQDDYDEEGFEEILSEAPWYALPLKDKRIHKLTDYFEFLSPPRLIIIGQDGKTLNPDAVELIREYGIAAYPFTPEKQAELAEIEKAKIASQKIGYILVSEEKDFVIDKSGSKVPVSQLVGNYVLIYFSAHWCDPCRAFTPKLIKAYNELKAKESAFEVTFVSCDSNQAEYDKDYSYMPWLALPFADERQTSLLRKFKVESVPCLVAVGPDGKTITTEARHLITAYGADAFPFTDEHIQNLKEQLEEVKEKYNAETKEGYNREGYGTKWHKSMMDSCAYMY